MPAASFAELLALEPDGADAYLGASAEYPWGRIYGGQVVAQALWAAAATVDPDHRAHSLHAYFIRSGDPDEPVRFEVDRIRDGRSFLTRRVVAQQSGGAILNLSASFQSAEDEIDVQSVAMPHGTPDPGDIADEPWATMLDRRPVTTTDQGSSAWLRVVGPLPDDPVAHACALAFATDDIPMEAIMGSHPTPVGKRAHDEVFMAASLDHAIWFHRHAPADEWQFHDLRAHGLTGGRGLAIGNVFSADGTHVATVAQEGLLRLRR